MKKYSNEEFVKELGKGSYGIVDLYKYTKIDGSSFHAAVKSGSYVSLMQEVQILNKLRDCPRIVNICGNDLDVGLGYSLKLLLEYATEGSLRNFMNKYKDRRLPDLMIRDFTRMIVEGLVAIHSHGYVHCDLKSDNLLIFPSKDNSYELKIADFGLSLEEGQIPEFWEEKYPFIGTPHYMSPESLKDGVAMQSLDLWSLGCIVLEMYMGEKPWSGVKTGDLVPILSKGETPTIPRRLPCAAREFIQTCFANDPCKRGSASELLSHRFLERIDDDDSYVLVKVEAEAEVDETVDLSPIPSNGNAPEIPESLPCDVKEFIRTCLARDPFEKGEEGKIDDFSYVLVKGEAEVEDKTQTILEERKESKLKMIFPSEPPQFREVLSKFSRLKNFLEP
ncbi:Mitogen-activated protein kinase kinase kinase 20 [Cardamine amara subsp. amara]|uniref:Mitogen-activated protein kinase kinase kinase 20 n=1 Tax=Cardamine amara subsp. amara TaxID=228776 RepID=A0ABD1BYZ3_CARAN